MPPGVCQFPQLLYFPHQVSLWAVMFKWENIPHLMPLMRIELTTFRLLHQLFGKTLLLNALSRHMELYCVLDALTISLHTIYTTEEIVEHQCWEWLEVPCLDVCVLKYSTEID